MIVMQLDAIDVIRVQLLASPGTNLFWALWSCLLVVCLWDRVEARLIGG
jgi:hypothetical protein